jgi:hypothetical protein
VASDSLSVSNLSIGRPDFFPIMGIHIIQGRAFASYDVLTERIDMHEIVVNEGLARRF